MSIIDQLKIPKESVYIEVESVAKGWEVIRNMNTRGAPAIAITGCLALAVQLYNSKFESVEKGWVDPTWSRELPMKKGYP